MVTRPVLGSVEDDPPPKWSNQTGQGMVPREFAENWRKFGPSQCLLESSWSSSKLVYLVELSKLTICLENFGTKLKLLNKSSRL